MEVRLVQCKSALVRSQLPGLDWALNPYRGCGHACAYCYSQDVTRFEPHRSWGDCIEVKTNIVQRLGTELEKGARGVYGLGTVTDPYQPVEKEYELTRGCLLLLKRANANVSVLTKSDLVLRDLDVLMNWANVEVGLSVSTLDEAIARTIERGAPPPERRFDALSKLTSIGVRIYLMIAPIIAGVSDSENNLRALVRRAERASTKTIMWDKFNPKPMASARLRKALQNSKLDARPSHSSDETKRIRSILRDECRRAGIELLDAF